MKLYYQSPKEEIQVVKPDSDGDEYEIWLVTPRRIGTAIRAGEKRIICDGQHFSNIAAAIKHALERAGRADLGAKQNLWMRRAQEKVSVTGSDLVKKNLWEKFCAHRKINIDDFLAKPKKTYLLSKTDVAELGLDAAQLVKQESPLDELGEIIRRP